MPSKPPRVTIPERLELEYMLDQRRLMKQLEWFTVASITKFTEDKRQDSPALQAFLKMSTPEILNEQKLRQRLRQLAYAVADQKVREVGAVMGARVLPPSAGTIIRWIDWQVEATRDAVDQWLAQTEAQLTQRTDADTTIDIIRQLANSVSRQRESRASAAILQLNAEIIEETARSGGSSHYRWETERDNRVRTHHEALDDRIFAWDEPPTGGGTRARDKGHPGSGYGCRCVSIPYAGARQMVRSRAQESEAVRSAIKSGQVRGSVEASTGYKGRLKPGMDTAQAEATIRGLKREQAMAWTGDGAPLMRLNGTKARVKITAVEVAHLQKNPGAVFTHNHPGQAVAGLSSGDIHFALQANLSEMRAVIANGTGQRLRVFDQGKWQRARSQAWAVNADVKRVTKKARAAAKAASARIAGEGPAERTVKAMNEWVARSDAAYAEAYREKLSELLNQVGREYGFAIEQF